MLFQSFQQWWGASARNRRSRARRKPAPRRHIPRLDVLEDRTLLSTLLVRSAADNGSAGTLRAVLAAAHSGDTIQFARALDGQTITLTQGQLVVNQSVTINGPGAARLTVSGNAAGRIFDIGSGVNATISGLRLINGLATDGGAIFNAGNLTLTQDVFSANVAQGTSGGGNAFGGAVYNEAGTVNIDQSTFTADQAIGGNGGSVGVLVTLPGGVSATLLGVAGGGAIWTDGGSLTITNSTLTNNLVQGGSNGNASGSTASFVVVGTAIGGAIGSGAFFTTAVPSLTAGNSTFSGNQSLGGSNVTDAAAVNVFPNPSDAGSGRGGALGAVAGNVSISNSSLTGNTAQGGALVSDFQNSKNFTKAGAAGFGGGVDDEFDFGFVAPASPLALSLANTSITGDRAAAWLQRSLLPRDCDACQRNAPGRDQARLRCRERSYC